MPKREKPWLFRCDGGPTLGLGHLYRCLALMEALDELDVPVVLATLFPDEVPRNISFPVHPLRVATAGVEAAKELAHVAERYQAGGIIFDHYDVAEPFLRQIQLESRSNLQLVCIGNSTVASDVISLLIRQKLRPNDEDLQGVVAGAEYLLMRKAFRDRPRRTVKARVERLLITLGGSRTPYFQTVLNSLNQPFGPTPMEILVVGRGLEMDWSASHVHKVTPLGLVDDMAGLLEYVDLAVTACGTTLYQMAACGLPAIGISVADNQLQQALDFADEGLIHFLGRAESLTDGKVFTAVRDISSDQVLRQRMSDRGQSLVDGYGASRCARRLRSLT